MRCVVGVSLDRILALFLVVLVAMPTVQPVPPSRPRPAHCPRRSGLHDVRTYLLSGASRGHPSSRLTP